MSVNNHLLLGTSVKKNIYFTVALPEKYCSFGNHSFENDLTQILAQLFLQHKIMFFFLRNIFRIDLIHHLLIRKILHDFIISVKRKGNKGKEI